MTWGALPGRHYGVSGIAWTPGSAALLRTLPSLGTPSQALHGLAPFPLATAADPRDARAHLLPRHAPRLHRGPPGPRPPPRNAPPSCGPRSPFTPRPPDCRCDPNWPCSSAACSGLSGGSPQDRPPHPGSRAARTPPGPGLRLSPPPARGLRLCGQPATPPAPSPRANATPHPRGRPLTPSARSVRRLALPRPSQPPLPMRAGRASPDVPMREEAAPRPRLTDQSKVSIVPRGRGLPGRVLTADW